MSDVKLMFSVRLEREDRDRVRLVLREETARALDEGRDPPTESAVVRMLLRKRLDENWEEASLSQWLRLFEPIFPGSRKKANILISSAEGPNTVETVLRKAFEAAQPGGVQLHPTRPWPGPHIDTRLLSLVYTPGQLLANFTNPPTVLEYFPYRIRRKPNSKDSSQGRSRILSQGGGVNCRTARTRINP